MTKLDINKPKFGELTKIASKKKIDINIIFIKILNYNKHALKLKLMRKRWFYSRGSYDPELRASTVDICEKHQMDFDSRC